ncbi:SusC/RagA family TonB-linked outer membrane protein [Fulvivirgaceae bacterium BMA10]|uniref:SusC/RagA family TonB-linked outer membrane protein n=1 Tax=Splendidivirga corallicola TaxID=3051826 RepID=A0ABT8KNB7_9BACT|nr:SusC/RagA family TonB-linked outer membrane protein [Fulvivirgaceae bacterium BMA10]
MKLSLPRQVWFMTKITLYGIFLQVLLCSVLFAATGNAQKVKLKDVYLSINLENVRMQEALVEIGKKTDFNFLYDENLILDKGSISVAASNESLFELLRTISKNKDLKFKRINENIYVSERGIFQPDVKEVVEEPWVFDRDISGRVTDEEGNGLPGANVLVKDTNIGTITDTDGNYKLSIPDDATTLVFSYVGYLNEEVEIAGRSVIDLQLTPDLTTLSEVIVVGYGEQKKVSLTGSAISVDAEEIRSIPTSALSNTLAGRAPGVQIVNNSGFVGANSNINIRGAASPNGTTPLYVIDNIVQSKADFDLLDPNEVESITFLKDAATASIYGARASNGVVLVKTRSGEEGKAKFTYKNFFSTQRTTKPLPNYTAQQEIIHLNNVAIARGQPVPYGQDVLDYFANNSYSINDELWRNPNSQQHNLTVSGGSDKLNYFMLAGFNRAKGPYDNTNFDRYNFRSKVEAKVNDNLKIGLNINGNRRVTDRFYWPFDWDNGEGFTLADFYRTTFNWSRLRPFYTRADGTPTNGSDPDGFPITFSGWNPVEMVTNGNYRRIVLNTWNGIINFDLDIPGIEGLSTQLIGNYKVNIRDQKNFVIHNRGFRFQPRDASDPTSVNFFIPGPINFSQVNVHNVGSSFERIDLNANFGDSYQINWLMNYDRTFGAHTIAATAGFEQAESNGRSLSGSREDLLTNAVDQILVTSADRERSTFGGGEGATARQSWLGRLHYEFDSKYIAEFSFRYDGSYKFPSNSRWGFFPTGSFAWRISEENFFNVPLISNLKLRGSVGTTGNDGTNDNRIPPFQFQNNYNVSGSYLFGDGLFTGVRPSNPPNPFITWEKSTTYDLGLEFDLLDGKLYGEFDYFYRKNTDLLGRRNRTIPDTYGAGLTDENFAQVDVQGFEIILNYKNQIGDIKYEIGANMGYAKNEIKITDEPDGLAPWRSIVGRSLNRYAGYISKGIIRDQATLDGLPDGFTQFGRTPQLGDLLFEDIRGQNLEGGPDGIIDANDWTWLSDNAAPRINYGISLRAQWKGLSIDALFQGVGAFDKIVRTLNTGGGTGAGNGSSATFGNGNSGGGVFQITDRPYFALWTDAWSPDNQDGAYPRLGGGWAWPESGHATSSFWIRNGSYLRLKNLNVAYALPKNLISPLGIEGLSVFFTGTNLFVISEFKEHDPEQATLDSFPLMKTFTGGLSINF